jgi:TolB protein
MRQIALIALALLLLLAATSSAQDWIRTGTGLGVERVRLAASDFKPSTTDAKNAELLKTFNDTLWNDLDNAGIFDLVSKSFYPLQEPGQPSEVNFPAWNSPPPNTSMLAFGNLGAPPAKSRCRAGSTTSRMKSRRKFSASSTLDNATSDAVRVIAHKFADEIIFRLGGGIAGIAESKIYFVSERTGHKEIWMMDYDGANQQQITHQGSISLSPRISPDGSRLAFQFVSPRVVGKS